MTKINENFDHPEKNKAVKAALELSALQGWSTLTLRDIAIHSGLKLSRLFSLFEDKDDILRYYARSIDLRVIEAFEEQSIEGESARERLFDIVMERFDLLNDDRDAVIDIMRSYRFDPVRGAIALPYVAKSMARMLELAEIECEGWRGCLKVTALSALYLDVAMRVWSKDDSPDMTRTMAALDRALERAEQAANSFGL
jgi:AcrR family transcriptional regulator